MDTYEKKYKKALERAKDNYNAADSANINVNSFKNTLIALFPELAESEDERIRKELTKHLKELSDWKEDEVIPVKNPSYYRQWASWLERQGEHANFRNKIQVGDKVTRNENGVLVNLSQLKRVAKPSEKQCEQQASYTTIVETGDGGIKALVTRELPTDSEQKPDDKTGPKFKVGDWIVDKSGFVQQVLDFRAGIYTCTYNSFTTDCESNYHLWTIADAKDGDVLSYVTDEEDLWIMIYWSLYEPYEGHVHYHALLINDNFSDKGTCCICIDNLKPATKEQRSLLFCKMKEAGYEWDCEKKELRRIEQRHTDKIKPFDKYEGLTDFERTLADICIGWIGEELGWKQYIKDNADVLLKIAVKKFNSVQDAPFEPKLEENKGNVGGISANWSEEDKRNLQGVIDEIEANKNQAPDCDLATYDRFLSWLKSLKNRVQPKQEWSEEEIEKAAQEWDSKANFNPFYMTMEGDKPTGVKQSITTHKESFKAGIYWILEFLKSQK